uniref:Reverse transcriptase n=1 Tax=Timema douglasi TaxID=61478 RepID=A0A7R8ZCB5_TIMDO|nr:unnamed protein product [Timema douglasi]
MALVKTTFLLFMARLVRNPAIKFEGKNLRRIQTVRYLGVSFDENRNLTTHIEEVMGRAQRVMNKIINIGQRRFHLPMRIINTYHQAILLSIVGYGACVWAHRLINVVPARAVQIIQRNKKAIGYWKRKSNWDIVRILASPEVETSEDAKIARLREWQRCQEGSETGRRAYQLFPNMFERIDNVNLEPSLDLVHFITGKGTYTESLSKMGFVEYDLCECGEVGTLEHVVLECARTLEIRRPNQQEVQGRLVGGILRDPTHWRLLDKLTTEASKRDKAEYIMEL